MRIARVRRSGPDGPEARIVVAAGEVAWFDVRTAERLRLERAGASPAAARRIAAAVVPGSLTAALEAGEAFREALARAVGDSGDAVVDVSGAPLLAPVDPPAFRDFMAFEQHFRTPYDAAGRPVPDVLYELPVSYLGSAQAILGPDDEVRWPAYSDEIDFELELGLVVGRRARNLRPEDALDAVLGLTVLDDFSGRDIQRHEMTGRLGPSKGKHFATAVGPWIATLDELDPAALTMTARVNGEVWTTASSGTILWPLAELVAWASTGEELAAGTLLGTGTVGGGCGLELGRYLEVGDVVELEIDGLGVLRNRIGRDPDSTWRPESRLRKD